MNRCLCPAVVFLVLLGVLAVPASAQEHELGKKGTATLSKSLIVGDRTLAPGEYQFQCQVVDGRRFLVVTAVKGKKEVARVPCEVVTLAEKPKLTQLRTARDANGALVLKEVRIAGEEIGHAVVAPGP